MKGNFVMHCISEGIEHMRLNEYDEFLQMRRMLMANKIREYYQGL